MLLKVENLSLLKGYDWSAVLQRYRDLCQEAEQGKLQGSLTQLGPYTYKTYDLPQGILTYYDGLVTTGWYQWVGGYLESIADVCAVIRQRLDTHDLKLVNFNFYQIESDIKPHVDQKEPGEADDGHCNLNYIVSSQDDCCSAYVDTIQGRQSMTLLEHECYLIDTTVRHGVYNKGQRAVFQIKFHSSAQKVRDWLILNPGFLES